MKRAKERDSSETAAIKINRRKVCLLIIAIGIGVFFVLNPPTFDITVNGAKHTVSNGTTIDKLIDDGLASPTAGNLLAVDASVITEGVWDHRYKYINELRKMGAAVTVDGRVAVVEGVETLRGASVDACDLRAGAAMVIAGLCARGVTLVEDIQFIERGYENFVGKLRLLGADIRIIDEPDGTERGAAVAG